MSRSQLKELQKYQQSSSKGVEQTNQEESKQESKQELNQKSNEGEGPRMESNEEGSTMELIEEGTSMESIEEEPSMVEKLEPFLRECLSTEASHEDCNHGQYMVITYFDQVSSTYEQGFHYAINS